MNSRQSAADAYAAGNTNNQTQGQGRPQRKNVSPGRKLILAYWGLALPHDPQRRWVELIRVAYIQPLLGIVLIVLGAAGGIRGYSINSAVLEIVGGTALVIGVALALISYPISQAYYYEYPGRFSPKLEEYVARRVSRLPRDEFIPRYKPKSRSEARTMARPVSVALSAEVLRAERGERGDTAPTCGVLVVGSDYAGMKSALWDAMKQHLSGWSFVWWPHHMDYPENLADSLGQRIVLWIDDLRSFANLGEAAALDRFIQDLHKSELPFVVLTTCGSGADFDAVKRYFRPLINEMKQIRVDDLIATKPHGGASQPKLPALPQLPFDQRTALELLEWLRSQGVHTISWDVLKILARYAPNPDGQGQALDRATLRGLAYHPSKFVRVMRRTEVQDELSRGQYKFREWRNTALTEKRYLQRNGNNNSDDDHVMLIPLNLNYSDLAKSHETLTKTLLGQQPPQLIQALEMSEPAVETLVVLGDVFLNDPTRANELALGCFDSALKTLTKDNRFERVPGAWAAAHVGKGSAELREREIKRATEDFEAVTSHTALRPDDEPTAEELRTPRPSPIKAPRMLVAHAWHGLGDTIAAEIPSDIFVRITGAQRIPNLDNAARYFKRAANQLPARDALVAETKLDRANVLYVIARVAARLFSQSLTSNPSLPPSDEITRAEEAFIEVRDNYLETATSADWAELHRRLGQLCLMKSCWLVPASMQSPLRLSDAAKTMLAGYKDPETALKVVSKAHEYFEAVCTVFAPSYLPMSWFNTQLGLVRADILTARLIAKKQPARARAIYDASLVATRKIVEQIAMPGHSVLDWVDVQLLRVRAEMGRASVETAEPRAYYNYALDYLDDIEKVVPFYEKLRQRDKPLSTTKSTRTAAQMADLETLREEIQRAVAAAPE